VAYAAGWAKRMKVDYIIVGQGIAGSMLSWFLFKENKSFCIIDKYNASSASNVAAGIIHPITGRRIVKTWMADILLPFADKTYNELEIFFSEKFFYRVSVLELLCKTKEVNDWQSRAESAEMKEYISSENNDELYAAILKPFIKKIQINHSAWLDMQKLVTAFHKFFSANKMLINESFQHDDLKLKGNRVFYKGLEADKIIFCEGAAGRNNPFWKSLPFLPAKGEILTIKSKDLVIKHILASGIFILPLGNDLFKVGSTFEWNELNEIPTSNAREKILSRLEEIINVPYEVAGHTSAIRPTVKERRPFLGIHSAYNQVGIFNGLGTKGALLAPYFAKQMTDHLLYNGGLLAEVDVKFKT
jgi:glycine/D-amino acid oxidase-like deaminating enzyme